MRLSHTVLPLPSRDAARVKSHPRSYVVIVCQT
jgi:hypothetical protein